MNFSELVRTRYSVRAYRAEPVDEGLLAQVLEAARWAPTAANHQPFGLVVAHTAGRQEELGRVYHRPWFVQPPIVICACGIAAQAWVRRDGKSYLDVDVAIVMDHLTLAAADSGLGTCWIANFNAQAARAVFGLPDEIEPIALTPLGYPADHLQAKERKTLAELVHYETW